VPDWRRARGWRLAGGSLELVGEGCSTGWADGIRGWTGVPSPRSFRGVVTLVSTDTA